MNAPGTAQQQAARLRQFAEHMAGKSWCVDVSGTRPVALHADSNRPASSEVFTYEYVDWERSQQLGALPSRGDNFSRLVQEGVIQELPRVFGSSFRPTDEKFFESRGALMANTYRPYRPEAVVSEAGVQLLEELSQRLFTDVSERNQVLQYLAHIVFRPAERPQFGLLITGAGGTGKSLLITLVEKALGGRHSWRENDYNTAFKPFSEVLPNNLLVAFDDAPAKGSTYDQLKHAITSQNQEVEIKGVQRRVLREVYARIVVLSNDRKPFDLTDDRRFFVPRYCVHKSNKTESDHFFQAFVGWLGSAESGAVIYHWLSQIDLSDFNLTAPEITDTHRSMSHTSSSSLDEIVSGYVQDRRLVHIDEVSAHAARMGISSPNVRDVAKALANAGYISRRRSHPSGTGQLELWVPAARRRQRSLTTEEIGRMMSAGVLDAPDALLMQSCR